MTNAPVMRVHLLGVRGSTPAPGKAFVRYGGHTSSVAVSADEGPPTLVLDAGTGIRSLPELLDGSPFDGSILLTHLHWDHTQGLPFCPAIDRDDARVDLWIPAQEGGSGVELLARGLSPPHFPIDPYGLRGHWRFHDLEAATLDVEGFKVTATDVPHKGGRTLGFRVTDGTTTLTYIPDHGPIALGPGPHGWGELHPAALALAEGADVLLHDAQHTPEEFAARAHYGHSVVDYAVSLGQAAGVGTVVLFHHDPARSDDDLDEVVTRLQAGTGPEGPLVVAGSQGELVGPFRRS